MHQLGSLLSATIEYYAADQIEMCYSEKKKEKKSLPSLCRQSSRRFENRSPLHLTSQLRDFVLNLLSQFALGGHSTTTWTKFYPILTTHPPLVDKNWHFTHTYSPFLSTQLFNDPSQKKWESHDQKNCNLNFSHFTLQIFTGVFPAMWFLQPFSIDIAEKTFANLRCLINR